MLEGVVQNLLLGYLGSYVKNIQREQLKIGLWNGEVLLENVELNLEAFDNLQFPLSLKQGQVGRLSIKIPWKKLGWDPIIISLENVFIRACQRDDTEWNLDSVERREHAVKKARLDAAEVAKLTRRVSGGVSETKIGQTFISYLTAKILDGIQVSIRDVHFIYTNKQSDPVQFVFGLRLSNLTMKGSYSGKLVDNEVHKIVKVSRLGVYCNTSQGEIADVIEPQFFCSARFDSNSVDYILDPCDVALSLVVNRSGQVEDGVPQYSISAELATLVLQLNENQMQQILNLWDYLGTCHLREKYGRFRPCFTTLRNKPHGWQRMWWQYAQESVLSDIRKRLRKTSWRYLGWRISYRNNYVSLYKKVIRQAQPVDKDILLELEQLEKEIDVDDILTYRSIAERESQEFLLSSTLSNVGRYSAAARQQNDDGSSAKAQRGWINLLSLGMLGAGGTEDSIQFSGVVSDEIVKDIYEVTQFHPTTSPGGGAFTKNGILLFSIKFRVHQINATLLSKANDRKTTKIIFDSLDTVFKLWEESWNACMLVHSVEMDDLCTGKAILISERDSAKEHFMMNGRPFITFEVDMSSLNHEPEMLIKAVFEPFEATYELDFFLHFWELYLVLESFQSHSKRVISSLNGFEDVNVRLLSKAECIFSNRTKVICNASFSTVILRAPWRHEGSEYIMVLEFGSLQLKSKEAESSTSVGQEQISIGSTSYNDMSQGVQLHDFFESFEIVLSNFEVNIMRPNCRQAISVFDRFNASVILSSCIIPDEPALNKLEVHFSVSSLCVHFSPSIYGAFVGFNSCLDRPILKPEPVREESRASASFKISADLKCVSFHVTIADDADNSVVLILALGEVDILCANQETMEGWLCIKTLGISTGTSEGETSSYTYCTSRTLCTMNSMHWSATEVGVSSDGCGERNVTPEGCVLLHYQAQRSLPMVCQKYSIYFAGLDFHIYPDIVGLLVKFSDLLSGYGPTSSPHSFKKSSAYNSKVKDVPTKSSFEFQNFGFSNFYEDGTSGTEGIPLDHFPFVTIHNSGSLGSLRLSLIHSIPEWRHFRVREGLLVRNPKVNFRKRTRVVGFSSSKLLSPKHICAEPGGSYNADIHIELKLNSVKVYFHDSSCILATLTLPLCKSFIAQDAKCLDVLCSFDGLLLSSSWATQDISEFLWGYSEPNISPILNIRLRKKDGCTLNQEFEVSISAQHVCCVLPSEFLAILIGYFSLRDWSPRASEKYVRDSHKQGDTEDSGIKWNIEILDSKLAIPVERNKNQSLHLGLQQLYFSFTTMNHKKDALKDIPLDCMVPEQKVADSIRLLNIFGRNVSLSLVLLEDEEKISVKHDQDTRFRKVSLLASADIDLWIRIPCEDEPCGNLASTTCIMTKVDNCQIIAEDAFFLIGLDALLTVINEFSTVGRESEGFKSNVLEFLQLKKILKESIIVSPVPSSANFSEVRCCVNSLSIKLKRSRLIESIPSQLIASLDMQFQFSASLRDDVPLCLDIRFSSLALHSFHSCVNLVQCMCDASVSSCFDIHFTKSNSGVNEVLLEMPSVHIWLYLLDWCDVLEHLVSHSEQLGQTSFMNAPSYNSNSVTSELTGNEIIPVFQNELETPMLSSSTVCMNMEDSVDLLVRSERIGLLLHYPLFVNKEETHHKSRESEINQETSSNFYSENYYEAEMLKNRHLQYVTLVLHSKDTELFISGNHIKFTFCVEEASGMLDRIKEERVLSWSIFQLFHVTVVAIYEKHKMRHTCSEILVDSLDLSVSNQLFDVWPTLGHQIPESGSSQSSFMSMDLKVQFRKASLRLTDSTCSCNGPILEILLRNLVLHSNTTGSAMKTSLASDLLVNYFNLQKVMWEPFIETWNFLLNMTRTRKQCSHLNSAVVTDFHLTSTTELNLNLTEPMIEVIFRLNEMIKRLWGPVGFNDLGAQRFLGGQTHDSIYTRRYAPYILQNETSLPLLFHVYRGLLNGDDLDILSVKERIIVYPGSSVPIYTDETPGEQNFRFRPPQSSDRLNEKKSFGARHHMISVQLDGTSGPSMPISMDTIGLSHFEVNFSKALDKEVEKNVDALNCKRKVEEKIDSNSGFVVPVVLDVSTLHYRKLIRVYSTVILLNTTSITLELRFDTPFGVSPKVLDQIYPGQEFPLPLHLAEAGRLRWRPLGTGFLWSEAHMFSRGLSEETKLGSFRSFVCYPSHPSSDPFRCCLSIQLINISSSSERRRGSSICVNGTLRHLVGNSEQNANNRLNSRIPSIHYVTLTTPLLVRNFMPSEVSLTIESGGVTHTVSISEVESASIFHIDSSHDLGLVFHVHGFGPSISKFPRAEAFVAVARFHDNKFSQTETLTFYPDSSNGPIYVTVEKMMDALCGARELCIFVPFLLYNCTGLPITVADLGHEMEGCTMPPCYHLIEMDQHLGRKHSPILLSSKQDSYVNRPSNDNIWNFSSKNHSISMTGNEKMHSGRYLNRHAINTDPSTCFLDHSGNRDLNFHRASLNNLCHQDTSSQSQYFRNGEYGSDHLDFESRKVKACMYFPHSSSSASELMVRLSICMPTLFTDNKKTSVWSSPFYLVPASGSTCVVVPQTNTSGAFIVSVTSSPLAGPFSGRTRAIIFQPRYVIINTCSKGLCYKQKGVESVFHLGIGQHSHLHWADPTRELLVSLVFNEPGWLWSGSFFPDHVGDTQVKMRNYVRGELSLIRVEVQNADVSIREEKIVGTPNGNSGTLLILLSDDKTGFMPYRIDNFSKERLRIYQEKCKTFETTVHSYMSCPYTWDEPCFPHRLVVEVLGERILGSYNLDEVTEQLPIYLASTSEKPGRQLFLNIQSDGAVKVLSIMDSSYLPKDMDSGFSVINEKGWFDQKEEIIVDYCERISVHLPFIGVSLIQSYPQELLFASAKDTRIDLMQNVEKQKFSFQILSLQVDNQLHNTAYPVILSLDYDYGGNSASQMKNKDDNTKMKNETVLDLTSERPCQPIFFFSAVKGRNKETSLVFFEYIMLRLAPLRIELEEEIILCLFDFFRNVVSMMQSGVLPCLDSTVNSLAGDTASLNGLSVHAPHYESLNVSRGQHFPMSVSKYLENCRSNPSLPSVVPVEDFWQQIYILARKQNKIYVEVFDLAPIRLTLSFSSAPWMLRNESPTSAKYPRPISGTAFQRGLMALADVEGAPVYLKQLYIAHHMGTSESFHEILIRHYTPQLLHEMYKIFGSASVIGNPMGFAKNLGLGIKDFLSVPSTGILKSPSGIFTGMAKGTTSLFYSTVYAVSSAATQFSKSVHKSIVAFTFDDRAVSTMEKQWTSLASHSKGVLNEFLEGLTGFLQSPIQGAEKHGLPGFLSGVALGTAGLVARPMASIFEVTGRTAQSIRNRSLLHRSHRFRVRFPRPLSRERPLQPYSWEEAIGISILLEADDAKFKDEIFVTCRTLKHTGKFLVITERLVLVVVCLSLVGFGTPEFHGIADPQWVIEVELSLNNVIYAGREVEQVNIVGINSATPLKQHQHRIGIRRTKWWIQSNPLPLFQMTSIEFAREEEAENVLQVLLSIIEQRKEQVSKVLVLHRSNLR